MLKKLPDHFNGPAFTPLLVARPLVDELFFCGFPYTIIKKDKSFVSKKNLRRSFISSNILDFHAQNAQNITK